VTVGKRDEPLEFLRLSGCPSTNCPVSRVVFTLRSRSVLEFSSRADHPVKLHVGMAADAESYEDGQEAVIGREAGKGFGVVARCGVAEKRVAARRAIGSSSTMRTRVFMRTPQWNGDDGLTASTVAPGKFQ
jgi:hypothetical protein